MNCPRCAKENEAEARFCSRCGLDMHSVQQTSSESDSDEKFCYRHPRRSTLLSCGRCEKPICEKCVILGSAGPRCPECAKHNVTFRPGAVGLEAKRAVRWLSSMSPWMLIIGGFLILGAIRGCIGAVQSLNRLEVRIVQPAAETPSGSIEDQTDLGE